MFGDVEEGADRVEVGVRFNGHYEVLRRLGAGGMGVVFEVLDLRTERRRALKVLRLDEPVSRELAERFRLEATATANVRSPHIVEVLDAGIDDATGRPFLVMELLEGESAEARLRRLGRLGVAEVVACVDAIARALDELHAAGIVHRDLKPENLFFAEDAAGAETLKVIDFGAVKVLSASLRTTRTLGSPLYMSPEALEGDSAIDGRADIYALGHVVFTLLVGEAYWERVVRETRGYHAVLARVLRGRPTDARARASAVGVTLPQTFDAWFARATARRPEDRFETAGECAAAFLRVMSGGRLRRSAWGRRLVALAGAAAALAGVVVAATRPAAVGAELAWAGPPTPMPPSGSATPADPLPESGVAVAVTAEVEHAPAIGGPAAVADSRSLSARLGVVPVARAAQPKAGPHHSARPAAATSAPQPPADPATLR